MNKTIVSLFTLIYILAGFSQPANLDSLFSWSVALEKSTLAPGGEGTIDISLTVAADHIVYENMTSVSVEGSQGFQAGKPVPPEPHSKIDPIDGKEKKVYIDTVQFRIPFTLASDAPAGDMQINVTVKYQGCSQKLCYFPQTRKFPLILQVAVGTNAATESIIPPTSAVDINRAPTQLKDLSQPADFFARGYFLTFLLVYFFGILTSFTPCVYPLIPITVTIFGARKTRSTLHAFSLAGVYVLGIAVMYTTLGLIAATTGAMFGQFMSNPWAMSAIAIFFAAMGLSMMGFFELQLPSSLQTKLSQVGGEGYLSAFLMGLIAGIVAAPCTGPVLAGILAYVAATGSIKLGTSLLLVYSLGLGTLFLAIGTYSGMIQRLPKSGGWMEGVKSVFAVILFVSALYFLKNAFPILQLNHVRDWAIYAVTIILLIAGITNGAFHLSLHSRNKPERIRKLSGILACVAALFLLIGTQAPAGAGQVNWITNIEEGLALAKEQKKPVMIDFWAEWCAVCKEIDHYTFHDEAAAAALNERFVCIKIDLTRDTSDEAQALIQKYKINGLPLLVFYDSQGNLLDGKRINEFINPTDFLKYLDGIQ